MNLNTGQNHQNNASEESVAEAATLDYIDSKLQLSDFSVIKESLTADAIPNLHNLTSSQHQHLLLNINDADNRITLLQKMNSSLSERSAAHPASWVTSGSTSSGTARCTAAAGTSTSATGSTTTTSSTTASTGNPPLNPLHGTFLPPYPNLLQLQDPSRHALHQYVMTSHTQAQSMSIPNQQPQHQQPQQQPQQSHHAAFNFWNLSVPPQFLANHQTALNLSSSPHFFANLTPLQNNLGVQSQGALSLHSITTATATASASTSATAKNVATPTTITTSITTPLTNNDNHDTKTGNKRKVQDNSDMSIGSSPQKVQHSMQLQIIGDGDNCDIGDSRDGGAIGRRVKHEKIRPNNTSSAGRLFSGESTTSTAAVTCTTNATAASASRGSVSGGGTSSGRTFQSAFLPFSQSIMAQQHPINSICTTRNVTVDNDHHHHQQQQQQNQSTAPCQTEKITPENRRRYERNLREQQRSQKINQQIKELRKVLQESQVPFRQNKYSILTSVVDYITQLQQRSSLLANEHLKLVNTIRQTSDIVNSGCAHGSDDVPTVGNDTEIFYVQGLDYKAVFEQCSFPIAVAALDGRFLAWNPKFTSITGLSNQYLEKSTLFGLLSITNRDEVFRALGTLLRRPGTKDGTSDTELKSDSWRQDNLQDHNSQTNNDSPTSLGDNCSNVGDIYVDDCHLDYGTNNRSSDNNSNQHHDDYDSGPDKNDKVKSLGYWTGPLCHPNQNIHMYISVSKTCDGQANFFNCSLSRLDDFILDDLED